MFPIPIVTAPCRNAAFTYVGQRERCAPMPIQESIGFPGSATIPSGRSSIPPACAGQGGHAGGDRVMAKALAESILEGAPPFWPRSRTDCAPCVAAFGIDRSRG